MPLYFAYGSNMDAAAMAARCPDSRPLGRARLDRHRFLVMRSGYASVLADPARTVWGLLWDLAAADEPALDRYEEVDAGLYDRAWRPVDTRAGPVRALVYLGCETRTGTPRPAYQAAVVAAAEAAGLPPDYLAELRGWGASPGV